MYSIADNTVHKINRKTQNPDRFETAETNWAV